MRKIMYFVFIIVLTAAAIEIAGEKTSKSAELSPPLYFCGEKVPLEDPDVYERLEKQLLVFAWRQSQVILWMKRSGRYLPYIEKRLKENNMPDDLKYMAVVESALLPHIGSSKSAVGFWQFIKPTGLRYGLQIDSEIDERRNIFKSTEAAIKYLKKLYEEFGSWSLAAAAYNMGEYGLASNIEFQKTNDFYHLYLPLETQDYVPGIIAAKMILTDPATYGFHFEKNEAYSPDEFDYVKVECAGETSLQLIAEAAGTYYKNIKELNPEFRQRYLSGGTYSVAVPKGAAKNFYDRYNALTAQEQPRKDTENTKPKEQKQIYVVKRGESITGIAEKLKIPVSDILRWNGLNYNKPIHVGQRLVIYTD